MKSEALQKRKKKPDFVVKESKFVARVKKRWRFPRGMHSAVRQYNRGRPALPTPGYGSPRKVYGLDPSGLRPVLVFTEEQLLSLTPKESAVIPSTVGNKKKVSLLTKAQEKKIRVLNVKDVAASLEKINKAFEERKRVKREKKKVKETKEEEKKKKAKEKAKEETTAAAKKSEEKSGEEISKDEQQMKKEEQQKEAEKTIIKKQ